MKKKKLYSAFIMLLITAIALTTASYAWFTQNSTVSMAGLNVNVTAADGIQISMDAATWKAALTVEDIKGAAYTGHVNQVPDSLVPVSTAGTVANGKLLMYKGSIGANPTTGAQILSAEATVEQAGATGDFIAFDVFLLTSAQTQLYLTQDAGVTSSASKGLENAARLAFLVEGNVANGATSDAIALTGATSAIIWEPNNNAHTTSGIANAANNYGISIDATSVVANYQGVNAIIPVAANVPLNSSDTTYFQTVTPTIKTGTAPTGTSTLFTINAGITKVRIYAWVEGQDVDCENDASGTDVTFNIKFTKVA
ncbi:MAG: hypothetical protein IJ018_02040 [Bacilli bacterium]|nr:hypothetical protein [Bacilli bacterium]